MNIRSSRISTSISRAVTSPAPQFPETLPRRLFRYIIIFLSFFRLLLARYRPSVFASLRRETWRILDEEYLSSFAPWSTTPHPAAHTPSRKARALALRPVGDLGYSGSTFFTTPNGKFLVKSLPRRFEHTFFTHDLFGPYVEHMRARPGSLLVRITDMVYTPCATLGGILGLAPTHHIIMENLLCGKEDWEQKTKDGDAGRWETYDLKPNDYFFPERDIAGGVLTPQTIKNKLLDEFPGKVRVGAADKTDLVELLSADTKLLADQNAVDYSLFVVRYPGPNYKSDRQPTARSVAGQDEGDVTPLPAEQADGFEVQFLTCDARPWRRGLVDADGCWVYRAVVLDFFWAKHKLRAKAMSGVITTVDAVAGTGPMTITAEPQEYRARFLKMVDELVDVEDTS